MRFFDDVMRSAEVDEELKGALDGVTVISASNVALYYWTENMQEIWTFNDFPNVAPPFDKFWLDFDAPEVIVSKEEGTHAWPASNPSRYGLFFFAMPLGTQDEQECFLNLSPLELSKDVFAPYLGQAKWAVDAYLHWGMRKPLMGKIIHGPVWFWRFLVDDAGRIVKDVGGREVFLAGPLDKTSQAMLEQAQREADLEANATDAEVLERLSSYMMLYLHTGLLAISFMHCKNVALEEIKPNFKPLSNAQRRRGETPYKAVPYKIINIQPMRQKTPRQTSPGEGKQRTKTLHIARGHFKDFSKGGGLFGKYKGVYWWPMAARGSSAQGVTTKDYNISIPD